MARRVHVAHVHRQHGDRVRATFEWRRRQQACNGPGFGHFPRQAGLHMDRPDFVSGVLFSGEEDGTIEAAGKQDCRSAHGLP